MFETSRLFGTLLFYRLALLTVLKLAPQSVGVLAPVCSSMGVLASGSTGRSFVLPLGRPDVMSVELGNLLALRPLVSARRHVLYIYNLLKAVAVD